jgi:uncharacterized protein YrrD
MRVSEADGRPVISRASAETVGELKHVVVDVPNRRIAALHVAGGRRNAKMVDWSSIVGFGPDGIVVEEEAAARPPANDHEAAIASGKLDLDGRLVLTDGGDSLGVLTDVVFDERSGRLQALATGDVEHDADRLRTIGPYCVIVRAAPEGSPEA